MYGFPAFIGSAGIDRCTRFQSIAEQVAPMNPPLQTPASSMNRTSSRNVGAVPVCSSPSSKALIAWQLSLRSRGTKVA